MYCKTKKKIKYYLHFKKAKGLLNYNYFLIFFTFATCFLSVWVFAGVGNYEQQLQQAQAAYTNKNYSEATQIYQNIIQQGYTSPKLNYNLANAYYNSKQLGKAIVNYERALKQLPNDKDVLHNLALAEQQIIEKIEPYPVLFYQQWIKSAASLLSSNIWAIISLICVSNSVLFALLLLKGVKKRFKFIKISMPIAAILALITLYLSYYQYTIETETNKAVVIIPNSPLKESPAASGNTLLSISEGTKVTQINEINNWVQVQLPDKQEGWIEKNAIEII